MNLSDTLIFVDGENLTLRYQEMVAAGQVPSSGNLHIPDAFIWNQSVLDSNLWNLKRVSYYTSVVGDDIKVRAVRNQIAATIFTCRTGVVTGPVSSSFSTRSGQLIPFVHKKLSRSRKESVCDVQLTVDTLRACYRDHASQIWIFSGDGDFLSLFEEVVHSGKTVYVSAFSSGLNEEIPYSVDEFFSLDSHFFNTDTSSSLKSATSPPEAPADAQPL